MTTERPHAARRLRAGLAALLLGLLCAHCAPHESRRGDSVDISKYPPEIQASYQVFAVRCSRCHTLARPLNARIADSQHWVRYVNRMRLQPGSGIDGESAKVILRFLLYYHAQGRSQGEEQPIEPAAPPAPDTAPAAPVPAVPAAPDPAVPEAPGNGAAAPIKRQPRYGAMQPSSAADGRQS